MTNTKKFKIELSEELPSNLKYENELWINLKYDAGSFFNTHQDRERCENHTHTAILLVPLSQSYYEGGELILYKNDGSTEEITSDNEKYKLVVFPRVCPHEIKEVQFGIRQIFKRAITSEPNKDIQRFRNFGHYNIEGEDEQLDD